MKPKKEETKRDFDIYMLVEETEAGRKMVVWSFNPSFTFKSLLSEHRPRCVILTSGTLVPFETYESEFDVKFPI